MTRNRNLLGTAGVATAPARLPALSRPREGDWASLLRWIDAASERLQVREGDRRNKMEQVVTRRELEETYGIRQVVTTGTKAGTVAVQMAGPGGATVSLSVEQFADMIRSTRLYRDLMRAIDDPERFDRYGERVRALLLPDLGELAAKQGAAVRQIDMAVQEAGQSFAARKTEITAAIEQHVAGIRETLWAEANKTIAHAGKALQLTARLDDVDGSGASIEE
ncbi:MAG TPA: hypothetical protein VNV16_09630, partial [Methylibium sp.]|nr:hypothetical protein [Methylibium sp.]